MRYPEDFTDKIICGDALEVLKCIPSNRIDLIATDPPYGGLLKSKTWDNQWKNNQEYLDWCKSWFVECHRILKPDGNFYVFQNWQLVAENVVILKSIFPYFKNWITWERIKGRASKSNFKSAKEEILYFAKCEKPKFNEQKKLRPVIAPYRDEDGKPKGWFISEDGERVRWTGVGNVWHYTPPVWSSIEEKPEHPTQKPLMMMERIIESSSNEGDVVLDPFIGSGTTCVAAKKLKRQYIGVEQNKKYCEIAERRLNEVSK
jgi:site-specific DNA-methyltransferase (adenine-specific)